MNNYVNGLKIDFGLWSRQRYADVTAGPEPDPEFDARYLVLVPMLEWRIECDHPTCQNMPAACVGAIMPRVHTSIAACKTRLGDRQTR